MTECMPISSPPEDYKLERPGTSGQIVAPQCKIMDDNFVELAAGTTGNIMVKGPPVMLGYENNPEATRVRLVLL